jgi:hypothetical protein
LILKIASKTLRGVTLEKAKPVLDENTPVFKVIPDKEIKIKIAWFPKKVPQKGYLLRFLLKTLGKSTFLLQIISGFSQVKVAITVSSRTSEKSAWKPMKYYTKLFKCFCNKNL